MKINSPVYRIALFLGAILTSLTPIVGVCQTSYAADYATPAVIDAETSSAIAEESVATLLITGAPPTRIDGKLEDDAATKNLIAEYSPALESYRHPICISAIPLSHNGRISNLGHLLAAATVNAAEKALREAGVEDVEIDLGMMNDGGIRDQIAAGSLTWEDCIKVMPFDNKVVVLRLNAEQRAWFERGLARWSESYPIAGARMIIQPDPLEWKLYRGDSWEEIPADRPLVVAVSDYLANNNRSLKEAERILETDILVRTALKNYLLEITDHGAIPLVYWPSPAYLEIPMSMLSGIEQEAAK